MYSTISISETKVSSIAHLIQPTMAVAHPESSLERLIDLFREHRLLEAAVVDEQGQLCGVLNCRAVLNYYFEHKAKMSDSAQ